MLPHVSNQHRDLLLAMALHDKRGRYNMCNQSSWTPIKSGNYPELIQFLGPEAVLPQFLHHSGVNHQVNVCSAVY